ncbi:MAG TPA: hypothetical protein VN694_09565 [Caulobacteraceae bacterium]|nr:hypothetical protein [Caulobacteraceae bacterium]
MTSTQPAPPPQPRPEGRFGGWLLVVIGALMVVLCGGCTLTFWGVGVVGLMQDHSGAAWGAMVGLFLMTSLIGGLPTAGGAILLWAGWRVLHPIKTPRTVAKDFE